MADNIMTFRYVVKEVAITQGVRASFMPKPYTAHPGSAMHTHMSLFEGDRNAFHDDDDPYELSATGRAFVAGVLAHAREITAVTNQWVNSYKRLIIGGEAPTAVCWGHRNRSALVRVPMYSPGKASSRRVEIRTPDSACNPYLAYAVILAAGLRGVQQDYQLPPAARRSRSDSDQTSSSAAGYAPLPQNLSEALVEMENSELVAETLGEHVFDFFLRNKRAEWDNYRRHVTAYELRTYLPVL
jgi:glutamine synthetase